MAKTLDFNALKKKYLTVKLADENNTVLMIKTPTKRILDRFTAMKNTTTESMMDEDAVDVLYDLIADILSHNKGGVIVSREDIENAMDYEDIVVFIRTYMEFINEVINSKN